MKILLIKPPLNPNLITASLYEPLGLEYLAASVKGYNVRILDMRIDQNLNKELLNFRPNLIGITAYTCDFNITKQILKEIKQFDKSIRTVVGGHHATFLPNDFVLPYVDAIFLGYADSTFPQYVNALGDPEQMRNIPSIGIIDKDKVFFTKKEISKPDLDILPLPDRSLTLKYQNNYHDSIRNQLTLLMTSRGCPFRCNFCACWKLMNGKYVTRTPESIILELKSLPMETDVVYFSDDNTFGNVGRMWKLSELIKKNNIKKKLQMYARADTIVKHQDLFEDLRSAGLQFITIGLESFQDKDLNDYNKKTSISTNNQAILILKKLDIHILAHFIVRPEYTIEDFDQLYKYVNENNLFRPAFPVLTPLPGTELYEETFNMFEITNFDFFDFAHSILPTKLDPKEFYRQLANLYIKSYSIWRYVKHRINRLFSLNKNKYFTNNTDGITIIKLLLVFIFSRAKIKKIRNSYLGIAHFLKRDVNYI
ncbi:MAG: cobalamin-dependent protein [Bacteroidetes bacterium]|nr:cobalamin-dependent protein [Bacteroidota bacterium]